MSLVKMTGSETFTFQHHEAPVHSPKLIKNFCRKTILTKSHRLNSIENLWTVIESELSHRTIYSTKNLESEIVDIWSSIDANILKYSANYMPNRFRKIIGGKDKDINY